MYARCPLDSVIGSWLAGHETIPNSNSVLPSPCAFVIDRNSAWGNAVQSKMQRHRVPIPIKAIILREKSRNSLLPPLDNSAWSLRKFSFARLSLATSSSCFWRRLSNNIPNPPLSIAPIAVLPPPVSNIRSISPISPSSSVADFV